MLGEIIAFIVGTVFGVLSTCLIAAGRRGDDIQNMSIKQPERSRNEKE